MLTSNSRLREFKFKNIMTKIRNNKSGFTLIEVLVATLILCGAVLVLGAISTRSLSQTKLNRQYEAAMSLADKQLTMIDYMGVERFVEMGRPEGVFEETEPEYRWEVVTESLDSDYLYKVTVTVRWLFRNRPYSVSVDTMINGIGLLIEEEQDEETEQQEQRR